MRATPETLADVLAVIERAPIRADMRGRILTSIRRICQMIGCEPGDQRVDVADLRSKIQAISAKDKNVHPQQFLGYQTGLASALHFVGTLDPAVRGAVWKHPLWRPLMDALAPHTYLRNRLLPTANWCASRDIAPESVSDPTLQEYTVWLKTRTLKRCDDAVERDLAACWNKAGRIVEIWPKTELTLQRPANQTRVIDWHEFGDGFRQDLECYLAMRAAPNLFELHKEVPRRPLAISSVKQLRAQLRRAASVLAAQGCGPRSINSLADLVEPCAFKTILRHFHGQAGGRPSVYAKEFAYLLLQVARFHVCPSEARYSELESIASKLPMPPRDLKKKSKDLLRKLESPQWRRTLLNLPIELLAEVASDLRKGRFRFVEAQIAVAIDILLVAPITSGHLVRLNWRRNFIKSDASPGQYFVFIPKQDTKAKKKDLFYFIPTDVAERLSWYRNHILPRMGVDKDGDIFVTKKGVPKSRVAFASQLRRVMEDRIGFNVDVVNFRHFAANLHLEQNPGDTESLRSLFGYVGKDSERIYTSLLRRIEGHNFSEFVLGERKRTHASSPDGADKSPR